MGVPRSRLTRGSFQPRKARRLTEWIAFTSNSPLVVGATSSALFLSFSQLNLEDIVPCTIVRVHGRVTWTSDQDVASEDQVGAFGMALVREPARAIGITAIPTPIDEASDDSWFLHRFLSGRFEFDAGGSTSHIVNEEFDSKSMRQIEDGDGIVLVVENSGVVAAEFNVQARLLVMLH